MDGRDALLAIAMDGEPLPFEHGFPVRMVVPGLYGYVSATKWVTDLEVTRFADAQSYWTKRGWSPQGPVKTQSRIDVPRSSATVPAGTVVVAGTAWAQHRGVKGVQVRVDDGPGTTRRSPTTAASTRGGSGPGAGTPRRATTSCTSAPSTRRARRPAPSRASVPDGATGYDEVECRWRADVSRRRARSGASAEGLDVGVRAVGAEAAVVATISRSAASTSFAIREASPHTNTRRALLEPLPQPAPCSRIRSCT